MAIAAKRYAARIGREMEVLVEGESKKQNLVVKGGAKGRVWTGRTGCMRVVNFADDSGRNLIGRFLRVRITSATGLSLTGELVHDAAEAEVRGLHVGLNYDAARGSEVVG
jgi:tRNA A37 methylthiotransferase MiaB